MLELRLEKQGNVYHCYDEDRIIYIGKMNHNGSTYTMTLYNAFEDELYSISYVKAGFSLFRGSKPTTMNIKYHDQKGQLHPQERTYEWNMSEVLYTFICGEAKGRMDVIMRDRDETCGFVEDHVMKVRHLMYSAELSVIWMLMQERKEYKDRVFMEPEKFERAMQEVKQL